MEVRRRPTEPKVLGGIDFDGSTPHTIPGRRSTIRCCCRRPSLTGSGLRRPMPASGSESPAASLQCSGPAFHSSAPFSGNSTCLFRTSRNGNPVRASGRFTGSVRGNGDVWLVLVL
jgi:hypothetical protein